jgi:DNA end-binding protein Ku
MVDPDSEIRKGVEHESGALVIVEDEELEQLRPKPSRDIDILRFVPSGSVDTQLYDRPYYLGPEGDADEYFALGEALGGHAQPPVRPPMGTCR